MRVLELPAGRSSRDWGRIHGESFRGEIHSLAAIRVHLTCKIGGFASADQVLTIAEAHLPVLERYDADLYQELLGMAEAANISPAHVIVVNHYTDLRDIESQAWPYVKLAEKRPEQGIASGRALGLEPVPVRVQGGDADGGCSIVWATTDSGPVVAQTWDMHATAIPYVLMLHVPEHRTSDGSRMRPESWLFSLTGCLGMAGMNRAGVALCINNLSSTDARVGIVWPALVRRALAEDSARMAAETIMDSPVGAGHHYLTADATSAYALETSGERSAYIFAHDQGATRPSPASTGGHPAYVHTNHALDPDIAERSRVPQGSTTYERMAWLEQSLAARPVAGVDDLWNRLGSDEGYPRSVCTNMSTPENPHGTATCGAVAMELRAGAPVRAAPGLIHNVAPERFSFSARD